MGQPSFYIRIIKPEDPDWCKGTIEDIQTGEQGTFKSQEEMLRFMKLRLKKDRRKYEIHPYGSKK